MRSAVSEAAWARIEPLMPQAEGRSRPWRDHRQVVERIVFRHHTGMAWRDLHEGFRPVADGARPCPTTAQKECNLLLYLQLYWAPEGLRQDPGRAAQSSA